MAFIVCVITIVLINESGNVFIMCCHCYYVQSYYKLQPHHKVGCSASYRGVHYVYLLCLEYNMLISYDTKFFAASSHCLLLIAMCI